MKEMGKRRIEERKIIALAVSLSVLFLLAWLFAGYGYLPTKTAKYLALTAGLVPIAWRDWQTKTIPNRWLLGLAGIRALLFLAEAFLYPAAFWDNLAFTLGGAMAAGLALLACYVVSRHQIGAGDVKLLVAVGAYLGVGLTYFVLIGALVGAALYGGVGVLLKRATVKDEIAFAPFVAAAVLFFLALGF